MRAHRQRGRCVAGETRSPTFKNLSNALEDIEGLLQGLSTMSMDASLRARAQASRDAVDFLVGAVKDFFAERPYQHMLGEEARKSSFAFLEIDKKRAPRGPDSFDPVFIIGHWRSGTTLLS